MNFEVEFLNAFLFGGICGGLLVLVAIFAAFLFTNIKTHTKIKETRIKRKLNLIKGSLVISSNKTNSHLNSPLVAILKHSTLTLFNNEGTSQHQFNLDLYRVDLVNGKEMDLFLKLTLIEDHEVVVYLFALNDYDKEDWFLCLRDASTYSSPEDDNESNSQSKENLDRLKRQDSNREAMSKLIATVKKSATSKPLSSPDVSCEWLNAILGRMFIGIHEHQNLKNNLKNLLGKVLKAGSTTLKGPESTLLGDIVVEKLEIGDSFPILSNPVLLEISNSGAVSIEVDVEYTGGLCVIAGTTAVISVPSIESYLKPIQVPLVLGITIKNFSAKLLLKIKPSFESNRIWIGLYEDPPVSLEVSITLERNILHKAIQLEMLNQYIVNRVKEKLSSYVGLPDMVNIPFWDSNGKGGIFTSSEDEEDEEDENIEDEIDDEETEKDEEVLDLNQFKKSSTKVEEAQLPLVEDFKTPEITSVPSTPSPDLPDSIESPDSPDSRESLPDSPESIESSDSPDSIESPQLPESLESPKSLDSTPVTPTPTQGPSRTPTPTPPKNITIPTILTFTAPPLLSPILSQPLISSSLNYFTQTATSFGLDQTAAQTAAFALDTARNYGFGDSVKGMGSLVGVDIKYGEVSEVEKKEKAEGGWFKWMSDYGVSVTTAPPEKKKRTGRKTKNGSMTDLKIEKAAGSKGDVVNESGSDASSQIDEKVEIEQVSAIPLQTEELDGPLIDTTDDSIILDDSKTPTATHRPIFEPTIGKIVLQNIEPLDQVPPMEPKVQNRKIESLEILYKQDWTRTFMDELLTNAACKPPSLKTVTPNEYNDDHELDKIVGELQLRQMEQIISSLSDEVNPKPENLVVDHNDDGDVVKMQSSSNTCPVLSSLESPVVSLLESPVASSDSTSGVEFDSFVFDEFAKMNEVDGMVSDTSSSVGGSFIEEGQQIEHPIVQQADVVDQIQSSVSDEEPVCELGEESVDTFNDVKEEVKPLFNFLDKSTKSKQFDNSTIITEVSKLPTDVESTTISESKPQSFEEVEESVGKSLPATTPKKSSKEVSKLELFLLNISEVSAKLSDQNSVGFDYGEAFLKEMDEKEKELVCDEESMTSESVKSVEVSGTDFKVGDDIIDKHVENASIFSIVGDLFSMVSNPQHTTNLRIINPEEE